VTSDFYHVLQPFAANFVKIKPTSFKLFNLKYDVAQNITIFDVAFFKVVFKITTNEENINFSIRNAHADIHSM
jgi:hypothetical protein